MSVHMIIKPSLPSNYSSSDNDPEYWRKIRYELSWLDCGHDTYFPQDDSECDSEYDDEAEEEKLLYKYSIDGLSWK